MNGFSPQSHLLLVILTPLIGAVVAWLLGGRGLSAVRQSAAVTSLATLGLAGWLVLRFLGDEAYERSHSRLWFGGKRSK